MSEQKQKYSVGIITVGDDEHEVIVIFDNINENVFCKNFEFNSTAKLVCRLLNEDAERVAILKSDKEELIQYLQERSFTTKDDYEETTMQAIKAIEQLKERE